MPVYEFRCNACKKAFSLVMRSADLDLAKIACPRCGKKEARQVLGTFFAKTSRKS